MLHYLNRILCAGGKNDLYQDVLIIQEQANVLRLNGKWRETEFLHKYTHSEDSEEPPANSCPPPGTAAGLHPVRRPAWWGRRGTDAPEGCQESSVWAPHAEARAKRGWLRPQRPPCSQPNPDFRNPGLSRAQRGENGSQPCLPARSPEKRPALCTEPASTIFSQHVTPSRSNTPHGLLPLASLPPAWPSSSAVSASGPPTHPQPPLRSPELSSLPSSATPRG